MFSPGQDKSDKRRERGTSLYTVLLTVLYSRWSEREATGIVQLIDYRGELDTTAPAPSHLKSWAAPLRAPFNRIKAAPVRSWILASTGRPRRCADAVGAIRLFDSQGGDSELDAFAVPRGCLRR